MPPLSQQAEQLKKPPGRRAAGEQQEGLERLVLGEEQIHRNSRFSPLSPVRYLSASICPSTFRVPLSTFSEETERSFPVTLKSPHSVCSRMPVSLKFSTRCTPSRCRILRQERVRLWIPAAVVLRMAVLHQPQHTAGMGVILQVGTRWSWEEQENGAV